MKNNLLLLLIIGVLSINKVKAQESVARHSVYVSPFAGINFTMKAPIYGGSIGYEFRLNDHLSLNAGAKAGYTQKNNPLIYDGNNGSIQAINAKLFQYSLYAGVKYYIRNFFINADFGYQEDFSTVNFKYKGAGSSYNNGKYAKEGLYQSYGVGYQILLKKGDHIEIFTNAAHANSNTSLVAGFRYSFGLR